MHLPAWPHFLNCFFSILLIGCMMLAFPNDMPCIFTRISLKPASTWCCRRKHWTTARPALHLNTTFTPLYLLVIYVLLLYWLGHSDFIWKSLLICGFRNLWELIGLCSKAQETLGENICREGFKSLAMCFSISFSCRKTWGSFSLLLADREVTIQPVMCCILSRVQPQSAY